MRVVPLVLVLVSTPALADSFDSFGDALAATKPVLDARLRFEDVDDAAFARDAQALTLRTRLGVRSGTWQGFTAYVEAEDVRALSDRYNSTANGKTQFPVVADPEGSEWNQAWVSWGPDKNTNVTLGRQRVMLDNQRFFGNSGFRQNEQTFDALQAMQVIDKFTLRYAYLDRVHRVFGHDNPNRLLAEQDLSAHLLNVSAATPIGALTGYGYFVDNQDVPATSARIVGLRLAGTRALSPQWKFLYSAEYAHQHHWRDGAAKIDADYWLGEVGLSRAGITGKLGVEVLGGDGVYAFQTPFATLHAFNGWADRFLTTPVDGLVDVYVSAAGKLGPGEYVLAYHDYQADRGSADYGHEWNALYRVPFARHYEVEVKAADYRSDGFAVDVRKLWVALTARW